MSVDIFTGAACRCLRKCSDRQGRIGHSVIVPVEGDGEVEVEVDKVQSAAAVVLGQPRNSAWKMRY